MPPCLFFILLSLPLLASPSPSLSFSLPSFLLFFHISFSLFPFLSHKFFPSLFSSSPLFHLFSLLLLFSISFSFPLSLLRVFFFRELLVLCTSKMYWMTLLIAIECNLIGIKRDFSFLDHELSHSSVCNFSTHSMAELFETSN